MTLCLDATQCAPDTIRVLSIGQCHILATLLCLNKYKPTCIDCLITPGQNQSNNLWHIPPQYKGPTGTQPATKVYSTCSTAINWESCTTTLCVWSETTANTTSHCACN